ncbi:hypothetical protein BV25DRAFT_1933358 [Artomyces pyxidatus]|uniref:Uncharacterized protein n=1 Tax=Artomyces pyxidatus TaxID=48021 RepID=A0ACB8T5C2_9AGAM|nr:hypothetical protein BV25DRAFT_1933358 [Artomyces pyxidatus]
MHATLTHEIAVTMLTRAIQLSGQVPHQWAYIDKPQTASSASFSSDLQPRVEIWRPSSAVGKLRPSVSYLNVMVCPSRMGVGIDNGDPPGNVEEQDSRDRNVISRLVVPGDGASVLAQDPSPKTNIAADDRLEEGTSSAATEQRLSAPRAPPKNDEAATTTQKLQSELVFHNTFAPPSPQAPLSGGALAGNYRFVYVAIQGENDG